jgi:hypothetical protein
VATFQSLYDLLKHARNPQKGKPQENNTWVVLREGTMVAPEVIAIKYHSTDILRFTKDGVIEVSQYSLCQSITTRQRLRDYANVCITNRMLPAVNGYKTKPDKALFLSVGWTAPFVAWGTSSRYIQVKNGVIDTSTASPHVIDVISEPKKIRQAMMRLGRLSKLLQGYERLHGGNPFEDATSHLVNWLMSRYLVPVDESGLLPLPFIGNEGPKIAVKSAMEYCRWEIARNEGWIGKQEVLTIE